MCPVFQEGPKIRPKTLVFSDGIYAEGELEMACMVSRKKPSPDSQPNTKAKDFVLCTPKVSTLLFSLLTAPYISHRMNLANFIFFSGKVVARV